MLAARRWDRPFALPVLLLDVAVAAARNNQTRHG
jgi:hypothetical protein